MKKINSYFKRFALFAIGCSFTAFAFGQTEINTVQGLKDIANNLEGNYKLTADITLTEDWTPIGEFKGTFDGGGHIIYGLRVNQSSKAEQGLFSKTNGATIKSLGIENAYVNGNERTGAIVGLMNGGLMEECYVANSYIEGRDHVGTIVGHMSAQAKLTNSYSTSHIYSREHQAGGLVGMINDNDTEISNCYFSGIVRCGSGSRPAGIVASRDRGTPVVKNCVNMASYVLGSGNLRLTADKSEIQKSNLYSISTTILGSNGSKYEGNPLTNLSDSNYGATKGHGANIPGGDTNAKSASFYTDGAGIDGFNGLGWNFNDTWKFLTDGYPVLSWQTAPLNFSILHNLQPVYSLKEEEELDFSNLIPSQALMLTFTTQSEKIQITGSKIKLAEGVTITSPEDIEVSIGAGVDFNCTDKINIVLLPAGVIEISTAEQLKYLEAYSQGSYKLTADIDLTGIEFDGLCSSEAPFMGALDGDGHIIRNFTIKTSRERVGFINSTQGATIKKLGFEGASVIGSKRVGVVIGQMNGGILEECYVWNSYSQSSDHVGALVGTAFDDAIVQNCYASSRVKSTGNQAGGLIGVTNNTKVSKSYFAGTVESSSSRANGIVGLVDTNTDNRMIVENCVALAAVLTNNNTTANELKRIIHTGSKGGALTNNYALASMILGKAGEQVVRTSADANAQDGKDVSFADAKTQTFYQNILNWDFTDTWIMLAEGYPVLKWQTIPINTSILDLKEAYSLREGESVDFSTLTSSHGLTFNFSSASEQILVSPEGSVTPNGGVFPPENATINISVDQNFNLSENEITVQLFPASVVEIDNVDNFLLIAQYPEMDYKLMTDIDLTGKQFNGIGTQAKPFTGSFDGNGHIIKNIKIEKDENEEGAGLFNVTHGATIKKLGVENASVKMVQNKKSAGGIIGQMKGGIIEECYISNSYIEGYDHAGSIAGSVYESGIIKNCYSTAHVYSREHQAGGIAGAVKGGTTIENTYFSGLVVDEKNRTIGLGGYHDSGDGAVIIKNSVNLAPYIFSGNKSSMFRVFDNNGDSNRQMTLTNNYSLSTTALGKPDLSDMFIVDDADVEYGAGKRHGANVSAEDARSQTFYTGTLMWDFTTVWAMPTNAYPVLRWQTERQDKIASTVYTIKDTYILNGNQTLDLNTYIFSSHGLTINFNTDNTDVSINNGNMTVNENVTPQTNASVALQVAEDNNFKAVSAGNVSVILYPSVIEIALADDLLMISDNLSGNYKMISDITLQGDWTPIATFTGTLDGSGYVISGLKYTKTDREDVGLFSKTRNATIKNLGLKNVNINIGNGKNRVGAIVANMSGGIVEQCYVTGNVEGREDIGSIVGVADGGAIIRNVYSTAERVHATDQEAGGLVGNIKLAIIENSYFAGNASSWRNVAGIVGRADGDGGTVKNTVNLSVLLSSNTSTPLRIINTKEKSVSLENNYSLSSASLSNNGVISTVFVTDENYGADKMHGVNIPEGDENAKTAGFYTATLGWDFTNVWEFKTGVDYPQLKVFSGNVTTIQPKSDNHHYVVFVQNNTLHVKNLEQGTTVNIYHLEGRLVTIIPASAELQYNLPAQGFYIVEITKEGKKESVKLINR